MAAVADEADVKSQGLGWGATFGFSTAFALVGLNKLPKPKGNDRPMPRAADVAACEACLLKPAPTSKAQNGAESTQIENGSSDLPGTKAMLVYTLTSTAGHRDNALFEFPRTEKCPCHGPY